jgi:signal transduction histidine kinase
MTKGTWSLEARITRWCVGVGTGFVALLAIIGCALVYVETGRELDAITEEELAEMIGAFGSSPGRREDFAAASASLQRSHPDDGMAWRVWNRADGSRWGAFGRSELLERIPVTAGVAPDLDALSRFRWASLSSELDVGLLLQGGPEVASERLFFLVAGCTVLAAAGASYLAGRFLGTRIGGTLHAIAKETRAAVQAQDLRSDPGNLPDEIVAVVAALREALTRIRDESDQTRLLASGLAHELRSPLQNLLTQLEVTLLRARTPEQYAGIIARQLADLQELIRAVDNLVTLCAPPEARRARHAQAFDLVAEARLRLAAEIERAAREGVRVRLHFPAELSVRGDRETLVLAMRNLLANAIDWSPAGGEVDLRLALAEERFAIEVDDQGPGVPLQERERIFQPFERGSQRPKGRIGYGLGLALVRTVARLHQGSVHVSSSPAQGARFRMEVPQSAPRPGEVVSAS